MLDLDENPDLSMNIDYKSHQRILVKHFTKTSTANDIIFDRSLKSLLNECKMELPSSLYPLIKAFYYNHAENRDNYKITSRFMELLTDKYNQDINVSSLECIEKTLISPNCKIYLEAGLLDRIHDILLNSVNDKVIEYSLSIITEYIDNNLKEVIDAKLIPLMKRIVLNHVDDIDNAAEAIFTFVRGMLVANSKHIWYLFKEGVISVMFSVLIEVSKQQTISNYEWDDLMLTLSNILQFDNDAHEMKAGIRESMRSCKLFTILDSNKQHLQPLLSRLAK